MLRALILAAAALLIAAPAERAEAQTASNPHHLVVITAPTPSPEAVRLLAWMDTDPALSTLRKRNHYQHFDTANPLYRERYATRLPPAELPIVALAAPGGGIIYKASGPNIPSSPTALVLAMREAFKLHQSLPPPPAGTRQQFAAAFDCPDGNCPLTPARPGIDWRPGDGFNRVVDGAIPDTVTIAPQIDAGSLGPWIAGAIVLAVLAMLGLGFFAVLSLAGMAGVFALAR